MDRDYEDVFGLGGLSDEELRGLVRTQLSEHDTVDLDSVVVHARDGHVTLSGRVGTEEERRIVDHMLTDVIGLAAFTNDIVIDQVHRDMEPEAADEQVADAIATGEDELGGSDLDNRESEDEERMADDDDAPLFGTHDVRSSVENGVPWVPPDEPTPEGRDTP
jgi:hypothetical protein